MAITQITEQKSPSLQSTAAAVDIVAIHDINEDAFQTWTDSSSNVLWLRDLLPAYLRHFRALVYSYKIEALTSPGVDSAQSVLAHANNIVAELCADRQLENAFDRPIIFVCHGFGGILAKRALAYSSSREARGVEHLKSIYTCTYAILFLGTPHNGISKDSLLARNLHSVGPNQFMISLLRGSEMLNEINDQFAPLMKQFSIYNFWEELKTQAGPNAFYVVDQESAAPAWDNVEKCGLLGTHSSMTKFRDRTDRRFRPILEALSRYSRSAPALIKSRWQKEAALMVRKRQQAANELLESQHHLQLSLEATDTAYNEWCLIPRKPSTYFTGRQQHARDVQRMLGSAQSPNTHAKTSVLVIYGLGGSGKTQFCLKYVEDNKHKYWGVFWVDASSVEHIESGFAVIGTQAGRGATKASAIHWLSQCKSPWLLVLDNADDPGLEIAEHFPTFGNGHVLITTRNPNVVEYATVGHIRFRGMDPYEAVSLLLKTAYPASQQDIHPATPMRWQLAEGVAIELGYLPLAIAHAGATIRRNIYTLERYLNYYLRQRRSMLSRAEVKSVDEVNIITTWEIPFQRIVSRPSMEHKDAVDLMHTFAFMHYETIPERIFQRSWDDWRDPQVRPDRCPNVLQPVWTEGTQARFRRALGVLCDHSIIEYEPSKGLCTMHPVVHTWARERLPRHEQHQWLQCTMAILSQCISPNLEVSGRQFRGLLLPHIHSCLQLYNSQTPLPSLTLRSANELERFAWVFAEQGQWKSAFVLQNKIVKFRQKKLGKRHDHTIRAKTSLGQTCWNLFEVKDAIDIQLDILDSLRWHRPHVTDWAIWPVWEPTHLPYCLALNEITPSLWLAGYRLWSRWTGRRAVDGLRQRLGLEDPLTLKAMFNLGRTYLHLGEEEKSHELLVWVLRRQKRYFGMNHPDTLMTRNELGILLCASKRHLNAAQRLVENVLQARKRILGEEHAYTLWSVNDLSKIYVEVGRTDEAVAILENIVPIVARTLGEDHVGMALTRSNLARAYFLSGKWTEAEETIRPLLELEKIDRDHPDWYHNMYGYAHILFKLGRVEEAEKYCTNVMDRIMRTKVFELKHPRTISIAELLILIYRDQGREDMILAVQKEVPQAGLPREHDQFDPYSVRRASHQASTIVKTDEIPAGQAKLQFTATTQAEKDPKSADPQKKDRVLRLVNSRTF